MVGRETKHENAAGASDSRLGQKTSITVFYKQSSADCVCGGVPLAPTQVKADTKRTNRKAKRRRKAHTAFRLFARKTEHYSSFTMCAFTKPAFTTAPDRGSGECLGFSISTCPPYLHITALNSRAHNRYQENSRPRRAGEGSHRKSVSKKIMVCLATRHKRHAQNRGITRTGAVPRLHRKADAPQTMTERVRARK